MKKEQIANHLVLVLVLSIVVVLPLSMSEKINNNIVASFIIISGTLMHHQYSKVKR